jgi:hypothetical protein
MAAVKLPISMPQRVELGRVEPAAAEATATRTRDPTRAGREWPLREPSIGAN